MFLHLQFGGEIDARTNYFFLISGSNEENTEKLTGKVVIGWFSHHLYLFLAVLVN